MTVRVYFDRKRRNRTRSDSGGRWMASEMTRERTVDGKVSTFVKLHEFKTESDALDFAAQKQEMEA